MKIDAAFEALKRANPEPDPVALRKDLVKRATSDVIDIERNQRPHSSRATKPRARLRLNSAFSFGLVALAIVLMMLVPWTGNRSLFDRIRHSPIDVAARYMDARNEFDAAAADELLAPDASLHDVPRIERDELVLGFEALRVFGYQFEPYECEHTRCTTLVTCHYQMTSRLSEIVGYPPVEGRIRFLVENGQITSLAHDFNLDEYARDVHDPYIDWLNQEHPGAFDELFIVKDGIQTQILSEASLALAESYLVEYDRFLNG